jgi:hypothetical protein
MIRYQQLRKQERKRGMLLWNVKELWELMQVGFKFDMMTRNKKVIRIDRAWSVNNFQYMYDCVTEDGTQYLRYDTASIYAAAIFED